MRLRRTGVVRIGWSSRAGSVVVVWTHGENGRGSCACGVILGYPPLGCLVYR